MTWPTDWTNHNLVQDIGDGHDAVGCLKTNGSDAGGIIWTTPSQRSDIPGTYPGMELIVWMKPASVSITNSLIFVVAWNSGGTTAKTVTYTFGIASPGVLFQASMTVNATTPSTGAAISYSQNDDDGITAGVWVKICIRVWYDSVAAVTCVKVYVNDVLKAFGSQAGDQLTNYTGYEDRVGLGLKTSAAGSAPKIDDVVIRSIRVSA